MTHPPILGSQLNHRFMSQSSRKKDDKSISKDTHLDWLEPDDILGIEEHVPNSGMPFVNLVGTACEDDPLDNDSLGVNLGLKTEWKH